MTESEWLASDDPAAMLAAVGPTGSDHPDRAVYGQVAYEASDRKLRLWCAAMFNLSTYPYPLTKDVLAYREGKEWDGEGPYDLADLVMCWATGEPAESKHEGDPPMALRAALLRDVVGNPFHPVTRESVGIAHIPAVAKGVGVSSYPASLAQAAYEDTGGRECRRCRSAKVGFTLSGTVPGCPDCRGTGRVGVGTLDPLTLAALTDCLEDAGCDEPLLRHLRGWRRCRACAREGGRHAERCQCKPTGGWLRDESPHVRGCWAVDLILGRE